MKRKILRLLGYLNLPRVLAHHLVGQHHTHIHRIGIGTILVAIGAFIAEIPVGHFEIFVKMFAHAIDGIGLLPYVEGLAKLEHHEETPKCETC